MDPPDLTVTAHRGAGGGEDSSNSNTTSNRSHQRRHPTMPHVSIFQQYLAKMSEKCRASSQKCRSSLGRCQRSESARTVNDLLNNSKDANSNPVVPDNRRGGAMDPGDSVPDLGQPPLVAGRDVMWTRGADGAQRPVAKVKSNSFGAVDRRKPLFRQGDGIR